MIDRKSALPVTRQCQLLSLSRSTAYYQPKDVSDADLTIMRRIDEMSDLFMGAAGYGIGWWLKIMTSTANVYSG